MAAARRAGFDQDHGRTRRALLAHRPWTAQAVFIVYSEGQFVMTRNVGALDRLIRFYLGLVLIGFALPYWAPQTGWNWIGWLGLLPLLSGLVASCRLYHAIGLTTRPAG